MMNLLQGASDDQVALIGCFVALIGSVSLMYVSFFVGPAARRKGSVIESVNTPTIAERPSIELPTEPSRDKAA